MKVSKNVVSVPLDKFVVDRMNNLREVTDEAYKIPPIKNDIAFRGQEDPASVELKEGLFFPLKGFRRGSALLQLAAEGAIDPKTGKVFDHIKAFVYEDLTERERIQLMVDHGQRESLSKIGLFNALERLLQAGYSEKDIATLLFGLLEMHYPPSRKIKDTDEDRLNYFRGRIQMMKQAKEGPEILRTAFLEKLHGNQTWPIDSDLRTLHGVFIKEMETDKTNKINRQNPGPKFLEKWNELLAKQARAAEVGAKSDRSISMLSRSQVEEAKKQTDSVILKDFNDIITRKLKSDKLPILDKLVVQLEALPEAKAIMEQIASLCSE